MAVGPQSRRDGAFCAAEGRGKIPRALVCAAGGCLLFVFYHRGPADGDAKRSPYIRRARRAGLELLSRNRADESAYRPASPRRPDLRGQNARKRLCRRSTICIPKIVSAVGIFGCQAITPSKHEAIDAGEGNTFRRLCAGRGWCREQEVQLAILPGAEEPGDAAPAQSAGIPHDCQSMRGLPPTVLGLSKDRIRAVVL